MTTLETKPIAFFFSPLSPALGAARDGRAGPGAEPLHSPSAPPLVAHPWRGDWRR